MKIQKSDAKYHCKALQAVMAELDGVQASCDQCAKAIHLFDKASEWRLGSTPSTSRDMHPSPWAMFEGQTLHDMVSYVHRLKRSHGNSTDTDLQTLKDLVPITPKTRKRRESGDSPAEASPANTATMEDQRTPSLPCELSRSVL